MKERPIIFSDPMVKAILEGRKTQTRSLIKPQPMEQPNGMWMWRDKFAVSSGDRRSLFAPFFPGDRLWVRESFQPILADGVGWNEADYKTGSGYEINYVATGKVLEFIDQSRDESISDRVTPSIHMPRWASRITLEITDVRMQRVQEISEEDARAEGIHKFHSLEMYGHDPKGTPGSMVGDTAKDAFRFLWDSINAKRGHGWDANPWVWAITFRRLA